MKMKKNGTASDFVIASYNDRPDTELSQTLWEQQVLGGKNGDEEAVAEATTSLENLRWELKRAGLKPSNGYAPMYAYQPHTRELIALCAQAAVIPQRLMDELHSLAMGVLASSMPWSAQWVHPFSDRDLRSLQTQLANSVDDGDNIVCFANNQAGAASVWLHLLPSEVRVFKLGGSYEEAQAILEVFNVRGGVLVADNQYASGWHSSNIDVILHLEAPKDVATLVQREARGIKPVHIAYLNGDVHSACDVLREQMLRAHHAATPL
jgi:hypothetical protein